MTISMLRPADVDSARLAASLRTTNGRIERLNTALQARMDHGRVQISVNDNGCGISEEDLPQIFIPFFTTKKDGTGVGMTLARQILTAHGGTVTVRSKITQGTTVTLTL